MNWMISGGCGFIGGKLCERLVSDGHRVRILDNLSVGSPDDLPESVSWEEIASGSLDKCDYGSANVQVLVGDVRESKDVMAAMSEVNVVVHLAANTGVMPSIEDPLMDCETNVLGTLNMLEGARQCGANQFVFASSGAPLGAQDPPIHEEKLPKPVSPYGASKLAGESYCHVYSKSFDLPTIALRFGNVYGPGSSKKSSVVAKFIREAIKGETSTIYGDGSQTRDFIYIDDLVDAIVRAGLATHSGEIFQIAGGAELTIGELAESIKGILANKGVDFSYTCSDFRKGEVLRNYADVSKAETMLKWKNIISIDEGLSRTVNSLIQLDSMTRQDKRRIETNR